MKRLAVLAVALAVAGSLAGCTTLERQPQIREAVITPAALKPGDNAVIAVDVSDKHQVVDRIVGVVREDPRVEFKLADDGAPPDEKAGDGVWSMKVDVPFMAPPGEFTLDLTAYNDLGDVVLIRTRDRGVIPLTASCRVVIEYADDQAAAAAKSPEDG